jgi:hypothetical protein
MRRLQIAIAVLLICGASGLAWVGIARAQSFQSSLARNQTINSSLYSAGHSLDIQGTINGDVYCAGQNVFIDATVHGDVLCAAQDVTIDGHVTGSVRVLAQNATMNATVGHSLSVVAETLQLGSHATVGQDAALVASTANLDGPIARDAVVRAKTLTIATTIGRNLNYSGSNLTLARHAQIKGSLTYTSTQMATIGNGAKVVGNTYYTVAPKPSHTVGTIVRSEFSSFLYILVGLLIFIFVLVLLMPQPIHAVSDEAVRHLGRTMLIGLLSLVTPFVAILLIASFVGMPLAFAALLAWGTLVLLSVPVTAYYLGSMVLSKSQNPIAIATAGCFILAILISVPYAGPLVLLITYLIGAGAVLLSVKHHIPKPEYRVKS